MQQLFDYFKNNPITVKQIRSYLKGKENLKFQLLQKYNDYKDRFSFLIFVRYLLLGIQDKKCLKCGKLLNNQQIRKNADYCSKQCANTSQLVKQHRNHSVYQKYGVDNISQLDHVKAKKTESYLQKYGVDHPLKSLQVIEHMKQTNLQKYGVQFVSSNKQVRNKIISTVKDKYGVQNVSQLQTIKNQKIKTCLQKYGTQYSLQNNDVKNKYKQTNLKRYGTEYYSSSQLGKQKIKKTNLQKYGVSCYLNSNEAKEKIRKTNIQKYGSQNYFSSYEFLNRNYFDTYKRLVQKFQEYVIPLFSEDEYHGYRDRIYKWKCIKCGNEWQQNIHVSYHIGGKQSYIPRCLNCYPFEIFSKCQQQVLQFIKSICNCNILQQDRTIIPPYELDIYIPQKKIAIQFDGLYWHSQKLKDKNYHLIKTEMCLQEGIQLVHIFQDEWLYKQDIVKDRIKNILGIYEQRIFARKCKIEEISTNICRQFLNTNHIQGNDNSKIRLGLFYENELVSVMTFSKPRFNRNYEYELVRFASKLGYQVIGGASKLLKYFQRKYNPKNIISYADRRYSTGKLYYALCFQFLNNSEPNYCWYKGSKLLTRYQCQKHKLKNILGQNFNPLLSETQNMYLNGYNKIYDCGNMVFIRVQ